MSLLSAPSVTRRYDCASSLTWASAHYYRHLFGLDNHTSTKAINVLWVSRDVLEQQAKAKGDWSAWQESRVIKNEAEMVQGIRDGLRELCASRGWGYEDGDDLKDWSTGSEETTVRFAAVDPTDLLIEDQIRLFGHTSVLAGAHGGALGLSLFLPPGEAAVLELRAGMGANNWHFQHMAVQMGHEYEMKMIDKVVDVQDIYRSIERWVLHQEGM